ncbi:MAG: GNAT family N-acetyltransferase [Thermoguttaceae bacterium]
MNVRLVSADSLTPADVAAWAAIQRSVVAFDSPYFRPEFTQAVAAVRRGVEVGVLEDRGCSVGFFPFQRRRNGIAQPVGGMLSDFHGVVARNEVAWAPRQLLRACGLTAWQFDHLPTSQTPFAADCWRTAPSPYIDLSCGWEGYMAQQHAEHAQWFKQAVRKLRRAERNAGPARVELDTDRDAVFECLVKWKVEQYERTGVTNVLAVDWTRRLLDRIRTTEGEAFSGMTSALYLGDALAAVLLSMRSYGVMHAWFSAYDPALATHSPGLLLWLELARRCPEAGIRRIDMGKGPEPYKRHMMSGAIDVAEGAVDLRPVRRLVRRQWRRAYDWARHSPLRQPLLVPGRMIRNMIQSRSLRP